MRVLCVAALALVCGSAAADDLIVTASWYDVLQDQPALMGIGADAENLVVVYLTVKSPVGGTVWETFERAAPAGDSGITFFVDVPHGFYDIFVVAAHPGIGLHGPVFRNGVSTNQSPLLKMKNWQLNPNWQEQQTMTLAGVGASSCFSIAP